LTATIGERPDCGDSLARDSIAQKPVCRQIGRRFLVARAILAMTSNTNTDIDSLIIFGQMALEQGWYDQESDYRPPYLDDEPVRLALSVDL